MSEKRLRLLMLVIATLALGSILLAACARPGTPEANVGAGQGAPSAGGGEPTAHMGAANFVQPSVNVPKGSKLMLVDDGAYVHILANGMWSASGTPVPAKEPGAPVVNSLQISGNNAEIGPFTTAGTFHIYCSIHPGMNLTITVK